jgi:M6 family metalloprotease-like protein
MAIAASLAAVLPAQTLAFAPAAACQLPAGGPGSTGPIDHTFYPEAIGTLKALMVFVDFSDAPAAGTVDDTAATFDGAAEWLHESSYGQVDLQITEIRQWFRMPHPSTFYPYSRDFTAEDHEVYVRDAVKAADAAVDFAGYDIYYFVANPEADEISFSPTFSFGPDSPIHADGATISIGVTFGNDITFWGYKVLDHETGHVFGLPDLYSYAESGDQHRFVGGWDLMGDISGHSPDLHAWFKWQLGWLTDAQVACIDSPSTTDLVLSPLETPGGLKMVALRTGSRKVTVVEFRTTRGEDADACATGVLVSTINDAVPGGNGPLRVNDAHPDSDLPEGCIYGLDDAARGASDAAYVDSTNGITIKVLAVGTSARIRVTRTSSYPPDVTYARKLTIASRGASSITISGRLTATPAYTACFAARSVRLQRFVSGAWVTVRTANTTSSGVWSYTATLAKGRYRLVAPQAILGSRPRRICSIAVSPILTLR